MIRVQKLFASALIRIDRVDHPADAPHVDPEEERSEQYSINLLERGSFWVDHRGRRQRVTAADLFLTFPGQIHRYAHDETDGPPGDACISVGFSDTSRDEVESRVASIERRAPVVRLNNRRAYLRGRLFDHLRDACDSLALDLIAAELLDGAFDEATGRLYGTKQLAWYGARVDRARHRLDDEYWSDHTLIGLARDAGMSPFHFARVFRELTGIPPHRYLVHRRLSAAADRLRGGDSVTNACYAVGFRSLSHFITTFRRTYGVSPSRISGGTDTTSS